MRQFGSVAESGVDMGRLKRWIALNNFLFAGTFGEAVENYRDRYSRSGSADFSSANIRIALEEILPSGHGTILFAFFSITKQNPRAVY